MIDPNSAILDHVEQLYAPPNDPVFDLVPKEFDELARQVFNRIGAPLEIPAERLWDIFQAMNNELQFMSFDIPPLIPTATARSEDAEDEDEGQIVLLPGYKGMFAPKSLCLPHTLRSQPLQYQLSYLEGQDRGPRNTTQNVLTSVEYMGRQSTSEAHVDEDDGLLRDGSKMRMRMLLALPDESLAASVALFDDIAVPMTRVDEYNPISSVAYFDDLAVPITTNIEDNLESFVDRPTRPAADILDSSVSSVAYFDDLAVPITTNIEDNLESFVDRPTRPAADIHDSSVSSVAFFDDIAVPITESTDDGYE